MIVNQKELASIIGISSRRVRELKEDGFFPTVEGGRRYKLETCVKEYIEYKTKSGTVGGASANFEKEHAEHEKVKKEITKLKLRRMKKELHNADDVEMFLGEMLINFKNRLLSVPNKIAIQVMGETDINRIITLLTNEIVGALEELSGYNPDSINKDNTCADDYDDGEEDDDDDEYDGEYDDDDEIPLK